MACTVPVSHFVYCVRNHYVLEAQGDVSLVTGGSQVYILACIGGFGWAADRLVTKKFYTLYCFVPRRIVSAAVSIIAI